MRRHHALLILALCVTPSLAMAQNYSDISWMSLDPGDDFLAQMLRTVLPSWTGDANGAGAADLQNQRTVVGLLVGYFSGAVFAIAAFWTLYGSVINIIRTSNQAKALHEGWHWMSFVRMPLALALMLPVPPTGTSVGQFAVIQVAMRGIGLGQVLYQKAVTAIGPDAVPIAQPFVPGTRTIVAGLLHAEMCRALVNGVTNNRQMVPIPQPQSTGTITTGGAVTWGYGMTPGNTTTGSPICGTVSVRQPAETAGTNLLGVQVDMAAQQRQILENVLTTIIRPAAEQAGEAFVKTRQAAALAPLMETYKAAVNSYTQQLNTTATSITAQLRVQLRADRLRSAELAREETRMLVRGFSGAGSYSLSLAHLSGATLSLLSNTPVIRPPTYEGVGPNHAEDMKSVTAATLHWRDQIVTTAQTSDSIDAPAGYVDLFAGATPGEDGASMLERVVRSMRFSEGVLAAFVDMTSPAKRMFQDPFSDQMVLGHKLILISLSALGVATVLASSTGTAATMAVSALSLNFAGVAATAVGHMAMNYLGTPIFYGLMSLLVPGMVLAFVLPMLPFGLWFAGLTGWVILVLEAWVSVALWMLSHLTFRGAELHGNGTSGYATMANIFFRPALMLIGLFLGYVVYGGLAWFLGQFFLLLAGGVLHRGWLVSNLLGLAVMMITFVVAHIVAATQSFRLISAVPHHVMTWVGFRPANRVDMDRVAQEMGAIGMAGALQQIQSATGSAVDAARKSSEQRSLAAPTAECGGEGPRRDISSDRTLTAFTEVVTPRG